MKFKVSKFLATMAIGLVISNFDGYILGMEKLKHISECKYQGEFDEIVYMLEDFIDRNKLGGVSSKWMVAFDILLFVKDNFNENGINDLKTNGKVNKKMSLDLIHRILLNCMLRPKEKMPFTCFNRGYLSINRLDSLEPKLVEEFCNCLMFRLKNICCRNTMSEDERIKSFTNILKNIPLTSQDGEIKNIDSVEDKLKKRYNTDKCVICYDYKGYMSTLLPCKHRLCDNCKLKLPLYKIKDEDGVTKYVEQCPFCRQTILDYETDWEQYKQ